VAHDPGETVNVVGAEEDVAGRMEAFMTLVDPYTSLNSTDSQAKISAEDQAKLAALGYMGGEISTQLDSIANLPDPKDKIQVYLQLLMAKAAFAEGYYDQAEEGFRAVLAQEPNILNAVFFLGRVLLAMGRMDEATQFLEEAKERLPEDIVVDCVLAVLYNQAGLWDQAVDVCRDGLAINEREGALLDQMGVAYQGMENWDEAVRWGEAAVDADPDQAEYWNNLGATYFAVGENEKALRPLREAVALDPDLSEAHFNLGASLAQLGRYPEAEKAYLAALDADSGNSEALVQLTKVLLHRGKAEEALGRCRDLFLLRPDDAGTHYFMSVAYRQLGKTSEAIASLESYLEQEPDFAPGYEEVCRLLVDAGREGEARKYARIAMSKGAGLPGDLRDLARGPEGM